MFGMRENNKNVLILPFKWILKYYLKVQASHVHHLFGPAILLVIYMCAASPTALSDMQWDHTSMLHCLESQSLCRREAVSLTVGIHTCDACSVLTMLLPDGNFPVHFKFLYPAEKEVSAFLQLCRVFADICEPVCTFLKYALLRNCTFANCMEFW